MPTSSLADPRTHTRRASTCQVAALSPATSSDDALYWIDRIFDGLFFIDICVNCCTAYLRNEARDEMRPALRSQRACMDRLHVCEQ